LFVTYRLNKHGSSYAAGKIIPDTFSHTLYEYNRSRINSVFGIQERSDLSFNIEELIEASDNDLYKKVQNRINCLSSVLPTAKF